MSGGSYNYLCHKYTIGRQAIMTTQVESSIRSRRRVQFFFACVAVTGFMLAVERQNGWLAIVWALSIAWSLFWIGHYSAEIYMRGT